MTDLHFFINQARPLIDHAVAVPVLICYMFVYQNKVESLTAILQTVQHSRSVIHF